MLKVFGRIILSSYRRSFTRHFLQKEKASRTRLALSLMEKLKRHVDTTGEHPGCMVPHLRVFAIKGRQNPYVLRIEEHA